jgi:hypothetical protein
MTKNVPQRKEWEQRIINREGARLAYFEHEHQDVAFQLDRTSSCAGWLNRQTKRQEVNYAFLSEGQHPC